LPSARKTRARRLWHCCPTRASAISPPCSTHSKNIHCKTNYASPKNGIAHSCGSILFLFQGEVRPKILHSSLFILHLSLVASLEIIFKIIFKILEGKAPFSRICNSTAMSMSIYNAQKTLIGLQILILDPAELQIALSFGQRPLVRLNGRSLRRCRFIFFAKYLAKKSLLYIFASDNQFNGETV